MVQFPDLSPLSQSEAKAYGRIDRFVGLDSPDTS